MLCKKFFVIITLCLFVLSSGCRRREEEEPVEPPEEDVTEAPEDFIPIPGVEPAVYISETPATAGQYASYRRSVGLDVPERVAQKDAEEPLTELSPSEAEQFATWQLCRLPAESEWVQARELVDSQPYPWDGPEPRPGAPIYLARDWLPGSEGEAEAMEKREELKEEHLERLRAELTALHKEVSDYIPTQNSRTRAEWRDFKNELISAVEKGKATSEISFLIERGQDLSDEILERLQQEKLPIRTMKLNEDFDREKFEEAVESYKKSIEELRDHSQVLKSDLVEKNSELSEEVRALKQRIEDIGEEKFGDLDRLENEIPELPEKIDDLEVALELADTLENFRKEFARTNEDTNETFASHAKTIIPALRDNMEAEADEEELESVRARIDEREEAMSRWSDAIGVEFEQEPQLLRDLRDLKRIRARRRALEHELDLLEIIVEEMD